MHAAYNLPASVPLTGGILRPKRTHRLPAALHTHVPALVQYEKGLLASNLDTSAACPSNLSCQLWHKHCLLHRCRQATWRLCTLTCCTPHTSRASAAGVTWHPARCAHLHSPHGGLRPGTAARAGSTSGECTHGADAGDGGQHKQAVGVCQSSSHAPLTGASPLLSASGAGRMTSPHSGSCLVMEHAAASCKRLHACCHKGTAGGKSLAMQMHQVVEGAALLLAGALTQS